MQFKNISSEEDFRLGNIRMEVTWEKEDVARFSDFFKRDMVDVVHIISDGGPVATIVTPQLPSEPASTDKHTCDGYPYSDANRDCQACTDERQYLGFRRMTESGIGVPEFRRALTTVLDKNAELKKRIKHLETQVDNLEYEAMGEDL